MYFLAPVRWQQRIAGSNSIEVNEVTFHFQVTLLFTPEVFLVSVKTSRSSGLQDQKFRMASRLTRIWPSLSRMRFSPVYGARFVSQSTPSSAAGATAVTDLQPSHAKESHGHAEVSPFEKVSWFHISP